MFTAPQHVISASPDLQIDRHTQGLICSNLELLLNYCSRFYDRQFFSLELMEKAKTLLWGSDKSISEIAYELGFEHPSHFTKIFRTKTGKSPKEFRQPG